MHISEGILSGSVLLAVWAGTKGRLAFIPDVPGEWRVIVRDEEGHQCIANVNVSELLTASVNEENSDDLWLRAGLGVSIIFNIAFIILWRARHAH